MIVVIGKSMYIHIDSKKAMIKSTIAVKVTISFNKYVNLCFIVIMI